MIYILGKETPSGYEDLDEVVLTASTKIEDILKYIYANLNLCYLYEYAILFVDENETQHDCFNLYADIYNRFVKYTPNVFLKEENKDEYCIVKDCLYKLCNDMKTEKEKQEHRRVEVREENERRLYEQLKAKFEG